jgi:hypothetical protein
LGDEERKRTTFLRILSAAPPRLSPAFFTGAEERASLIVITTAMMGAPNGLFLSGSGLFMLVAPATWYHLVPGVTPAMFEAQAAGAAGGVAAFTFPCPM